MDEVTSRKLRALQEKQDLDHLVELYTQFQSYIEELASCLKNEKLTPELAKRQEAIRLHLDDNQGRFLEWHEGEQLLNRPIFSLTRDPDRYGYDPNSFQHDVLLAAEKFGYLIRKREESLRELHGEIALLTSEEEAHNVTNLGSSSRLASAADTMARADEIMDKGLKWGGHLVRFGLWAKELLQAYGLWH